MRLAGGGPTGAAFSVYLPAAPGRVARRQGRRPELKSRVTSLSVGTRLPPGPRQRRRPPGHRPTVTPGSLRPGSESASRESVSRAAAHARRPRRGGGGNLEARPPRLRLGPGAAAGARPGPASENGPGLPGRGRGCRGGDSGSEPPNYSDSEAKSGFKFDHRSPWHWQVPSHAGSVSGPGPRAPPQSRLRPRHGGGRSSAEAAPSGGSAEPGRAPGHRAQRAASRGPLPSRSRNLQSCPGPGRAAAAGRAGVIGASAGDSDMLPRNLTRERLPRPPSSNILSSNFKLKRDLNPGSGPASEPGPARARCRTTRVITTKT